MAAVSRTATPARLTVPDGAAVFAAIWTTLIEVLGAPTASTVVRRSARRAAAVRPALDGLVVERRGLDFAISLPSAWADAGTDALVDLAALARELRAALRELTGELVLRRLDNHPVLRALGWFRADHAVVP